MNTYAILLLADLIEGLAVEHSLPNTEHPRFTMRWTRYSDGEPACIIGWASHLYTPQLKTELIYDTDERAAAYLGITRSQAFTLGYPDLGKSLESITPAQAAAVLRNLAATGNVDWSIAQ